MCFMLSGTKREGKIEERVLFFFPVFFSAHCILKDGDWYRSKHGNWKSRNTRRRGLIFQSIILFFLIIFSHIRLSHTMVCHLAGNLSTHKETD